jgi:hypothetical protein
MKKTQQDSSLELQSLFKHAMLQVIADYNRHTNTKTVYTTI